MSIETVARRYATALADVVVKSKETESVKSELKQWEALIASNSDLENAFSNPVIPHLKKEKVLEGLLSKTKPSKTTANFLRVLLQNNRLTDLKEINERFALVLDERSGVVAAEITSSRELTESEKAELRTNLEKLTGKRVNADFNTDGDLIGGVVTRVGSTVYDSSVKTQLENLKAELINA
jgi:F-type H+-transporting ATPase subunit delta